MKCKICFSENCLKGFMIRWSEFKKIIDMDEFLKDRKAIKIEDYYCGDWFEKSKNGDLNFIPATLDIENNKISFLGGRHRTSVLSKHLEVFPITVRNSINRSMLGNAIEQPLKEGQTITLPDLSISGSIETEIDDTEFKAKDLHDSKEDISIKIGDSVIKKPCDSGR